MEKRRSRGVVSGEVLYADVEDRVVVIVDDLVSTGTTLARAARASRERGAGIVYAAASHGLFVGDASQVLADGSLDRLVITDTVPPFRLDPRTFAEKVVILETAGLFAEAIRRMHDGGSIVELLGPED
jgi:ribose-phosphate pyrophosphokinase